MLTRVVRHRRLVTKEIQIDRLVSGGAEFFHLVAHLPLIEHGDRQGAEPAGVGNGDRQTGIHRPGHRRQHDRVFDLEQVKCSFGPATWPGDYRALPQAGIRIGFRQDQGFGEAVPQSFRKRRQAAVEPATIPK